MSPFALRVRTLNAAAPGNESAFRQETDRSASARSTQLVAPVRIEMACAQVVDSTTHVPFECRSVLSSASFLPKDPSRKEPTMEQRDFVDVNGRRTCSGRDRAWFVRRGFSVVLAIGIGATIALMIPSGLTAQGESDGRVCSNATLRGNYGLLASGTRALPPGGVTERFIALALWTFHGNGTFTQQPGGVLNGETTGVNPDPGEIAVPTTSRRTALAGSCCTSQTFRFPSSTGSLPLTTPRKSWRLSCLRLPISSQSSWLANDGQGHFASSATAARIVVDPEADTIGIDFRRPECHLAVPPTAASWDAERARQRTETQRFITDRYDLLSVPGESVAGRRYAPAWYSKDDVQFPLNWYVEKRLCPHRKLLLAYIAENSTVESKQFFESLDAWQRCPAE